MRRTLLAAAATLLAAACGTNHSFSGGTPVQPSGVSGQRGFQVGAFDRVELAGPFDVIVAVGGQPSVRAEGDTGLMERLDIRVEGGRLLVGLQEGYDYSGDGGRVTVHVTAPTLTGADIAGSGNMRVSAVQAQRFAGAVAGSGNLTMEGLQAEDARFDIAGSGDIEVAGAARLASLEIAGSGNARLGGFQIADANVSVAGSGNAEVHATGIASVEVVGSGNVTVTGGARCRVNQMGSGDVRCG